MNRSAPMKRTAMQSRRPPAPPKPDRGHEFASHKPKPIAAVMASGLAARPPAKLVSKTPEPWDQRIRDAANGEECSIRIPGACNGRTDTTVWCHLPGIDGGRGMGFKSIDLCGAFGCFDCHNVVDGRAPLPPGSSRTTVMLDFFHGHMRSLVRLKQKGLA